MNARGERGDGSRRRARAGRRLHRRLLIHEGIVEVEINRRRTGATGESAAVRGGVSSVILGEGQGTGSQTGRSAELRTRRENDGPSARSDRVGTGPNRSGNGFRPSSPASPSTSTSPSPVCTAAAPESSSDGIEHRELERTGSRTEALESILSAGVPLRRPRRNEARCLIEEFARGARSQRRRGK